MTVTREKRLVVTDKPKDLSDRFSRAYTDKVDALETKMLQRVADDRFQNSEFLDLFNELKLFKELGPLLRQDDNPLDALKGIRFQLKELTAVVAEIKDLQKKKKKD